ncbi:RidA family protein [Paenarthrobacter sp. YIM B13468]|uniref:RidA family protein n=1 Tax=Paenarthrobacter sp. YIM B13468 TaxID=3366295 RepID=UPI003671EFDC
MTITAEDRLSELGVVLPAPARSVANYQPYVRTGNLLFTSGQLPMRDGAFTSTGKLGEDLDISAGQEAARWCAANILAQAKDALGDLAKIKRLVKITVFVASTPAFSDQHQVANGVSDFLVEALGEAGNHARSAVGVPSLPMDVPVEIEAVIEVR